MASSRQSSPSVNEEDSGKLLAFACRGLTPVVLSGPLAVCRVAATSEACAHLSRAQHEVDLN